MKTTKRKSRNGGHILEIREGACLVKIYSGSQKKGGVDYPIHYLTYMEAGVRVRKGIADLKAAKSEAALVLTRLVNGETESSGMPAVEIQGAAMAVKELKKTGVPLLTAAREFRSCMEKLNGKGTLSEAVDYFIRNARPDLPKKTPKEVTVELLAAKKADGKSSVYLKDLQKRLKIFGEKFTGHISEISTQQMEDWLRGLGVGPKHRNNYANTVTTLFNFAKRCGYLSQDQSTAAENLTRAKNVEGDIEIYTPDEVSRMLLRLARFRPELLPYVAIGAFAGVRPNEMLRLNWSEIDHAKGFITIKAENAKTARRRLIPILPCLKAWLQPLSKKEGLVFKNIKIQAIIRRIVEEKVIQGDIVEEGVNWKQNALRHSFGSYRLSTLNDAPKLALEMGNSPAMIFNHYRELVMPDVAEKYWAIMPPVDYAEMMKTATKPATKTEINVPLGAESVGNEKISKTSREIKNSADKLT